MQADADMSMQGTFILVTRGLLVVLRLVRYVIALTEGSQLPFLACSAHALSCYCRLSGRSPRQQGYHRCFSAMCMPFVHVFLRGIILSTALGSTAFHRQELGRRAAPELGNPRSLLPGLENQ
jgi:hypothetical protein